MHRKSLLTRETRLGAPLTYFHIVLLLLYLILSILYIYRRTIRGITRPAASEEALNDI
jgi:hypothetical protein